MNMHYFILFVCLSYKIVLTHSAEFFSEELLIKPLFSEQLYASFQFALKWDTEPGKQSFRHTQLFPRALAEIIDRHNIQELHISLTGGFWRYETWGYPIFDAAPGAEVWAWFKPTTKNVNDNWKLLANSLSGLLCASFNFIDLSNTISPEFSFRPRGVVDGPVNSTFLRYSSLPREVVCTENLTPFKKLLPCDSKSGLASLLNSGYIHNTRYHSIGLHLRQVCQTERCDSTSLELQMSVSLVYDYAILGTRDWSFKKLFGQGLYGKCPLAHKSDIYVDLSSRASHDFELIPPPDEVVTSTRGGYITELAKYSTITHFFSIAAKYESNDDVTVNSPPALYASQSLMGYGQERGSIQTKVYNLYHGSSLDVILLQNIAWYVPIYLHTLKVISNGKQIEPKAIKYSPGRQREKPYYVEILLTLPPQSTTIISVDFDYVFLKWQEYPPDANHGFYIASAVLTGYLPLARNYTGLPQDATTISGSFNASRSGYLVQIRTENMVITLPTPDFSMPYNVICLACTVVALAFGPLHNITTKRLVLKKKNKEKLIVRLKNNIFGLVNKIKTLVFRNSNLND